VAVRIWEWCAGITDIGGGDNSAVPIWAIFYVIIPCHLFMCWSGEKCEKMFGWKLGYVLEEGGRKPFEFVSWATNGVLGYLLLWLLSSILALVQRKRGLKIFPVVFGCCVIVHFYISYFLI
jgi:hypothetical protein